MDDWFKKIRMVIASEAVLCLIAVFGIFCRIEEGGGWQTLFGLEYLTKWNDSMETTSKGFLTWVDFDVTYEALCEAYRLDVETYGQDVHMDWISTLAYLGCKYGGDFAGNTKKISGDLEKLKRKLTGDDTGMGNKITMEELTEDMKYYPYYKEAYEAVLGGMVGEYEMESENEAGEIIWKQVYGLKSYSPIAKGFAYSDFDDFGTSRSFGYKRQHLGHDMMGQIGTPIIAIESGYVEAIGWNRYGGWRIGIRSFDKKRYYYYAHLRQNFPYTEGLEQGSVVTAGDVIGYMGHTGYSDKENVNNIKVTHLHWGMQLIFDESQKEGDSEIWIDVYALTRFLYKHRSEAKKIEGTVYWERENDIRDPDVERYLAELFE